MIHQHQQQLSEYVEVLRRRALLCYKTPYLTPDQAIQNMPDVTITTTPVPTTQKKVIQGVRGYDGSSANDLLEQSQRKPVYLTLCEELIERNRQVLQVEGTDETVIPQMPGYVVREHEHVCRDWSHPHERLMDMMAAQVVAYAGRSFGLKYDHNCHKYMSYQHEFDFDVTTIQEIYPQLPIRLDERLVGVGDVIWNLCDSCLQDHKNNNYNDNNDNDDVTPHAHHCLLFPKLGLGETGDRYDASRLDTEGVDGGGELNWDGRRQLVHDSTALEGIVKVMRNRLYHAAIDYAKKSDIPSHDPREGATIYLDATSLAIPYRIFVEQMPGQYQANGGKISILVGPHCVNAKLQPTNVQCLDYATQLRAYMEQHFGVGDAVVSFHIVSSTASLFSRLILTHHLSCPPGTFPCLLPALARQATKETIMMENVDDPSTFRFFQQLTAIATTTNNIQVIPISPDDMLTYDPNQIDIAKTTPLNNIPQRVEGNPNPPLAQSQQAQQAQQQDNTDEMAVETGLVNIGSGNGYQQQQQQLAQDAPKPIDLQLEETQVETETESGQQEPQEEKEQPAVVTGETAGTSASDLMSSIERSSVYNNDNKKNNTEKENEEDSPKQKQEQLQMVQARDVVGGEAKVNDIVDEQFDLAFDVDTDTTETDGEQEQEHVNNSIEIDDGELNYDPRFGNYRRQTKQQTKQQPPQQ